MPAWFWVLFWWLLFAATHIGLSARGARQPLIERLGLRGFQALYSLISFATFVPLLRAYFGHRHEGPLLWNLQAAAGVRHSAMLLAAIGMAFLVGGFLQPSPVGLAPTKAEARGLMRITRHPFFFASFLWGLAHAILNGFLGDVLFFGGFVVFAVVGAMHQDARKRGEPGEQFGAFYAETSLIPFAAILSGRNRLVLGEMPWSGLVTGLVAALAIYLLHPQWFGS